jgi:hypothetical protein|tara:strand:+ start:2266 stop:2712 length:447 start_codon:yes stop_codon:yes gene_type:complete
MSEQITGACLCGAVRFSVDNAFATLFFCHCDQCRKMTGGSHAANLFIEPEKFNWRAGEESIKRYSLPNRAFSKAFCEICGSGVPFLNRHKTHMIVPAGTLNEEPAVARAQNIFCAEQPLWSLAQAEAPRHDGFPEKRVSPEVTPMEKR